MWQSRSKYYCLWIKWKLVLWCSPVCTPLKPAIAFETCNSQQKERSSVLIAGYLDLPVQTLTGWEALWNVMKETILGKEPKKQKHWRLEPRDLPPSNRSWTRPSTSVRLKMTYCDPWLSQRDFKWRKELARQNLLHFSQCFLNQAKEIRRKKAEVYYIWSS